MRNWLVGLPVIAGMAISGISPASLWPDRAQAALIVSTGSQVFEVDWSKRVPDIKQPFEVVWSKLDNGDTITGIAAFGNSTFEGTGLALETEVDICAYSGSCGGPGGSNADHDTDSIHATDDHPTDSDSDTFGLIGTIEDRSSHLGGDAGIDFGISTDDKIIHGPNQPDNDFVDSDTDIIVESVDHGKSHDPLPVSEPVSLVLLSGALFLFGWASAFSLASPLSRLGRPSAATPSEEAARRP